VSYNPIYSSDLFKDDGSIKNLIEQVKELDAIMSILDKQRATNEKRAKKMQQSVRKMNATQIEHQEVLEDEVREIARLRDQQVKLTKAQERLNASRTEAGLRLADIKEQQRKVNQINKLTVKLVNSAEGSYDKLSAQYSLNKIKLNQMSEAQRQNTEEGQKLEQQTREIYEEMKRLQEATGKFALNVGDYENSVRKVLKEQSKLYKELVQTREEYEALPRSLKQNVAVAKEYEATIAGIESQLEGMSAQTGQTVKDLDKAAKETEDLTDQLEQLPGAAGAGVSGLRGLGRQFKVLARNPFIATIAIIVGALAGLGAAFTRSEKGAQLLARATGVLQGIFSSIVDISVAVADKIEYAWNNPQQALKELGEAIGKNLLNRLESVVDFAGAAGDALAAAFSLDLDGLKKAGEDGLRAVNKFTTGLDEQGQKEFTKAIKETVTEIERETNAFAKLFNEKREIAKQNREIAKSLENAITEEEKYRSVADDITKSFAEREAAAEAAREATERRAVFERQLAENRLKVLNAEIDLRSQNGENVEVLLDQQLEAYRQLAAAEREYTLAVRENERTRDELKQDRLERDLDILIDGFDNQKTVNERLIADEELTAKKRGDILEQTRKLADDSFREQIKTIQEFTGAQVDANELINESDAVALNQKIRSLGLSEIIEGRLLEIVRDRKSAIQDLADAERDLINSQIQQSENEQKTFEERAKIIDDAALSVEALYQREIDAAMGKENELSLIEVAEQRRLARLGKLTEAQIKLEEDKSDAAKEAVDKKIEALELELQVEESAIEASKKTEIEKQKAQTELLIRGLQRRLEILKTAGAAATKEEIEIIQNQIKAAQNELESLNGVDVDIYSLLGLDITDEDKANLNSSFEQVKNQLVEMANFRRQVADRNVQASRDEVAQAQRALDAEIQNRNAGFAHMVQTKEKELADAKKRQKEALKEQRQAEQQQRLIQQAQQASNLVTATSKILAQKGDPIIAAISIGLMWSTFIASQLRASQITKRKFGKGGYEVVGGGTHAEGKDTYAGFDVNGQPAYVERGEGVSIIRASRQKKYGPLMKKLTEASNKGRLNVSQIESITNIVNGQEAGRINAYVTGSVKELQPLISQTQTNIDTTRMERLLTDIKRSVSTVYDAQGRITKRDNVTYVYAS